MKTHFSITALSAALLAAPLATLAKETRMTKKQMPPAVLAAVEKKYPDAKQTGYGKEVEDGKTAWEVKLEKGAQKLEVSLSADGKFLAEETVVSMKELPEAVTKALAASKYGKWKAVKAEKIVNGEDEQKVNYEIALSNGKQKAEVVFDSSGAIAKEETRGAGAKY